MVARVLFPVLTCGATRSHHHPRPPKGLLVMMMLMIRVIVTIRTGRCAPLSTPRFTRMPATGLAQNHPPPEVAR